MNDENDFALVPSPPGAVEKTAPGAKHILPVMVADTLALAPVTKKVRVGDHELCESDYRQILLWAEQTGKKPSEIVKRLVELGSTIQDGHFIEVNWDDASMRVQKFRFVPGLRIRLFNVLGGSWLVASVNMDKNPSLQQSDFMVLELNLEGLTELEKLGVSLQLVQELDLRHTPKLKLLWCESNNLTHVNFAGCKNLEEVSVRNNFLTDLALSDLPSLKSLMCNQNCLSSLDLSGTPALEVLDCSDNSHHLADIDGKPFRDYGDPIEVLDITPLRNLRDLKYDVGKTKLIQRSDQNF